MSEEIKERLRSLLSSCELSDEATVQDALAAITTLTAELTAARAEVERLRGAGEPFANFNTEGFDGIVVEVVNSDPESKARRIEPILKAYFTKARAALTPAEGERG